LSTKRKLIRRSELKKPKSLSPTTYNNYIKQFVDRYNYGYINDEGKQQFRFTTEHINKVWAEGLWTSSIDLNRDEHIKSHLAGEETYFYTSNPYSEVGLLVIDLDATLTSSYEDIECAAKYIIDKYHPGAYYDPSTNDEGIHLYFYFDVIDFFRCYYNYAVPIRLPKMHLVSDYLNSRTFSGRPGKAYVALLKELIEVADIDCQVCGIKGTFSSYEGQQYKKGYAINNRGNLCKLPRPRDKHEFMKLVNAPILTFGDIVENSRAIEKEIKRLRWELDGVGEQIVITEPSAPSPPDPSNTDNAADSGSRANRKQARKKSRKSNGATAAQGVYEQCYDPSAFTRTWKSVQSLARDLRRMPSYDEWNEFYKRHDLDTPPETSARRTRFDACVKFLAPDFDPTKGHASNYEVGEFLDDIKNRLNEEELRQFWKKNCRITYEDLDIAMGFHWYCIGKQKCSDDHAFEISVKGMRTWFQNLKKRGQSKRSCDKTKAPILRKALLEIGYITVIDPRYVKGKKSLRWGIGENFPKYHQEYVASDMGVLEATLNEAKADIKYCERRIKEITQQIEELIKEFEQAKGSPEGDVIEVQIKRLRNKELATLEGALEYNQNLLKNPNWMPSTTTKPQGT
jgi:hypothetical protein